MPMPASTPPNTPLGHALAYLQKPLIWRLCKLRPMSKAPILTEWNSPHRVICDEHSALSALADGNHGIGLVHEASMTGAFDIDSIECATIAFGEFGIELQALLAGFPRIKSRDGRDKIIFSVPESIPTIKLVWPAKDPGGKTITVFEIRGKGGQDVLPPSLHPYTGMPYTWTVSPFDFTGGIQQLPPQLWAIWKNWKDFKPQFEQACPWLKAKAPQVKTKSRGEFSQSNNVIGQFNQANSVVALLESQGYKKRGKRWLSPTSSSGIPGVVVFNGDVERCFSHHASDPLNDGYAHDAFDLYVLFEHGGEFGAAVREAANLLGVDQYAPEPLDVSGLLKKPVVESKEKGTRPLKLNFDTTLEIPSKKLRELGEWMEGLSERPTPSITRAGCIGFASVLTGRMYKTETNNWTALLMAIVGASGIGKNYIKVGIESALMQSGLVGLISGNFYTHQSAVYTELRRKPTHICISDEFGENFYEARKSSNSNKLTVFKTLKNVYSDTGHIHKPDAYSNMGGKEIDTTPIVRPSLTLVGLTTPMQFYSEIKANHIESGLINRFIIVNINKGEQVTRKLGSDELPSSLIEWIKSVRKLGDLKLEAFDACPSYTTVKTSNGATKLFDECHEMQELIANSLEHEHLDAMPWRFRENSMRLANSIAACENHESPLITEEIANFAINYVFGNGMVAIEKLRSGVGENDYHVQMNAILMYIGANPGCSNEDLSRRFRSIKQKERNEILLHLQDGGLIFGEKTKADGISGRGKPKVIWMAT